MMLHNLCDGDVLKIDKVAGQGLHKSLKWMAFKIDEALVLRSKMKKNMRK